MFVVVVRYNRDIEEVYTVRSIYVPSWFFLFLSMALCKTCVCVCVCHICVVVFRFSMSFCKMCECVIYGSSFFVIFMAFCKMCVCACMCHTMCRHVLFFSMEFRNMCICACLSYIRVVVFHYIMHFLRCVCVCVCVRVFYRLLELYVSVVCLCCYVSDGCQTITVIPFLRLEQAIGSVTNTNMFCYTHTQPSKMCFFTLRHRSRRRVSLQSNTRTQQWHTHRDTAAEGVFTHTAVEGVFLCTYTLTN